MKALVVAASLVLAGALPAAAQHKAHVHGAIRLEVALDAAGLAVQLHAPLDSLLGFERAPRNDAERRAADALLARMKSDASLLRPDPAAGCTLQSAGVESAVLAPGARASGEDEHAELEASYRWACGQPARLGSIDLSGLLGAYKRIARIEAQVVTPSGQHRLVLKRSETILRWGR